MRIRRQLIIQGKLLFYHFDNVKSVLVSELGNTILLHFS